jgi:hypothetical protein
MVLSAFKKSSLYRVVLFTVSGIHGGAWNIFPNDKEGQPTVLEVHHLHKNSRNA